MTTRVNRVLKGFEHWIVSVLLGLMGLVIVLSILELGWVILKDILSSPIILLEIDELLEIFGLFLLILVGLELLTTIKAYYQESAIHVEIVLEAALVAIARKVIVLDLDKHTGIDVLGLAALLVAVAIALRLFPREPGVAQAQPDLEKEVKA